MSDETKYYFPWVRKGLELKEGDMELDTLCESGAISTKKERPSILISAKYDVTPPNGGSKLPLSVSKQIDIISSGDILNVNPKAVSKTVPARGHHGFAVELYPYIELWEPDFPWRYTPALPKNNRLRPWIVLLVCKREDCLINTKDGRTYVSFNIRDNNHYEEIFPNPVDIWKMAHTQGVKKPDPEKNTTKVEPEFSRIIAIRRKNPAPPEDKTKYNLEENTEYVAMLVPSFETGRLRGLGYKNEEIEKILAQMPAWENSLEQQKTNHPLNPLDFPVYYQWYFKTGSDSFKKLATELKLAEDTKSEIRIDVSRMGNGFDYNTLGEIPAGSKRRNVIGMPAATKTVGDTITPFPSFSILKDNAEKILYNNLKTLVVNNPVFAENRAEITGRKYDEVGVDDPWVSPPVYGAKHIMATNIKDLGATTVIDPSQEPAIDEPPKWLSQLNLDVHYRSVAGLGKRTVQIHQEEFVNRAWKQVEAVNALNRELYQRLVSVNASDALKDKVLNPYEDESSAQYVARLMRYLGSMKNANYDGGLSLSEILKRSNIPSSFASASFQHTADQLAQQVPALDSTTLMENIAKNQKFSNMPNLDHPLTSIEQLYKYRPPKTFNHPYTFVAAVSDGFVKKISRFFNIEKNANAKNNIRELYTFKPKAISHSESYLNSTARIFAPNYKLMRYNDFFRDMLKDWNPKPPPGYVPKKRLRIDLSNIGNLEIDDSDETRKYLNSFFSVNLNNAIRDRIGEFLKSGKHKHCGYGYTSGRSKSETPNVIVLRDEEFNDIFSLERYNSSIVRVGGENGYYFVPMRVVKSNQFNLTAICSFVRLPDSMSSANINSANNCKEVQVVSNFNSYKHSTTPVDSDINYNDDEKIGYRGIPILAYFVQDNGRAYNYSTGTFCYSHAQLYNPLLWKVQELWRSDNNPHKNTFYTTLITKIMPFSGISPVLRKDVKSLISIGHWPSCNECSRKGNCNLTVFDRRCVLNTACEGCNKQKDCQLTMINNDCIGESIQRYFENHCKVSKYLFDEPDYIELNLARFETRNGHIIKYDTVYDFVYEFLWRLKYRPNKQVDYELFRPWYDLHQKSREISKRIYEKQNKQPAPADPPGKTVVENWQEGADQSELYERMIEVAKTYYAEFFADTPEGEKLRDKYITELLHSRYPAMAYPIFPEPVYYYLKMFSEKFFIPSIDKIPDNSVALFLSNEAFTEAYLCGMNTEMGRELLWREYPTDQRGSYFRKFWDSETTAQDIHNENFFDVTPLHTWMKGDLGSHHMASKDQLLLFAIKGKLMKLFPSTQVFLHKATGTYSAQIKKIDFDTNVLDEKHIIRPVIQAYIREDILLLGFKKNFNEALGDPEKNDFGYFLTFFEDVQDLNFTDNDTSGVNMNAADVADKLINKPFLYGKHLSLFTKKIN